jgi:hypothetical protein
VANSDLFTSLLHRFTVHQLFPLLDDEALPFIASEFYKLGDGYDTFMHLIKQRATGQTDDQRAICEERLNKDS